MKRLIALSLALLLMLPALGYAQPEDIAATPLEPYAAENSNLRLGVPQGWRVSEFGRVVSMSNDESLTVEADEVLPPLKEGRFVISVGSTTENRDATAAEVAALLISEWEQAEPNATTYGEVQTLQSSPASTVVQIDITHADGTGTLIVDQRPNIAYVLVGAASPFEQATINALTLRVHESIDAPPGTIAGLAVEPISGRGAAGQVRILAPTDWEHDILMDDPQEGDILLISDWDIEFTGDDPVMQPGDFLVSLLILPDVDFTGDLAEQLAFEIEEAERELDYLYHDIITTLNGDYVYVTFTGETFVGVFGYYSLPDGTITDVIAFAAQAEIDTLEAILNGLLPTLEYLPPAG